MQKFLSDLQLAFCYILYLLPVVIIQILLSYLLAVGLKAKVKNSLVMLFPWLKKLKKKKKKKKIKMRPADR